jgi:RHS repeat-associated protein
MIFDAPNQKASGGELIKSRYDFMCGLFALVLVLLSARQAPGQTSVIPNRSVPAVEPPAASLKFSDNPTTEEIFRAHIFQEPLVPVGGVPTAQESAALANALLAYARRSGPDDFLALTGFLKRHPQSPWKAALLTDLGLEYYNTAHFSLAIDAWRQAWAFSTNATNRKAEAVVDRAFGELINMDARLGRMDEMQTLLKSVEKRPMLGPAAERVVEAREALWSMQNQPEISFRCGPLALRSIRIALNKDGSSDAEILKSASTQQGCSLSQVADLSQKIGLNLQPAFRNNGDFAVPSVVHWKVGHYTALVRKEGNLYELQDPTFGNKTWATKEALEAETTGYCLLAAGALPAGWRSVDSKEASTIWGKGMTGGNDPQHIAKNDLQTGGSCPANGIGMAVASVHLMDVNLDLKDRPVGYTPPVGPPVPFTVRYNQRDLFQPGNFNYGNLGPQWTSDWFTYITDNPSNVLADVNLYVGGGGQRTYTGFNPGTQSFAYQQYDQNLLTRTGPATYQLLSGDGSRMIYGQPDGSIGTARNIFLTQMVDPQGNAVTLTYDTNLCVVAITDAIGQVTTLTYGLDSLTNGSGPDETIVPADKYKLTKVTDPFGRSAYFNYQPQVVAKYYTYFNGMVSSVTLDYAWGLESITDVIGITSHFGYYAIDTPVNQFQDFVTSFVDSLTTPYGTTTFAGGDTGNTRSMEITYPDGSRERVEYNQANLNQPLSDPPGSVPTGMLTDNGFLRYRDSYYWDRTACAVGYGDYSKARLYHFLHTENLASTAGALESVKQPLEGRVWYDYPGQTTGPIVVSTTTQPTHIGRVLDDGTTQLFTFAYNPFGHVINSVDPVGRTISYVYSSNGIDLLEIHQTRSRNNDLLGKVTYNSNHRPLTVAGPSGQATTYTYNARGQLLTATDAKNETTTFTYDPNGYLLAVDGPLPGTNDVTSSAYDAFGRAKTITDVKGYRMSYDYDNLDRLTNVTFPDGTTDQIGYDRLDCVLFADRAGRQTSLEYDNMRRMTKKTDPLGRATHYEWCRCGALQSLTDPLGRTTSWQTDVEGRRISKQYADGSQINYIYQGTISRLEQVVDERRQSTFYTYNLDNTLKYASYGNTAATTPLVSFAYDPDYKRVVSMKDGIGTTVYGYVPISASPVLGAGNLASVAGPLTNDIIAYAYDELGRKVEMLVDGAAETRNFDPAGRVIGVSNLLGSFAASYDGSSTRIVSETFPNGQTATMGYGSTLQDFSLQQIANAAGATPISSFSYGHDILRGRVTTWSQQAGVQSPSIFTFGYDAVNQLLSTAVTNSGALVNAFAYSYDPAGNRLSEQVNGTTKTATYNTLNQLSTMANAVVNSRSNEWDGLNRLTAVNAGNTRTEFAYDGLSRLAYIRELQNGSETSFRRFVWSGSHICEERDATGGSINKRFFGQGVKLQNGPTAGAYYYTRDHLGSIHELTDAGGNVRARYSYDPFGRRTKVSGDLDADFCFAGMLWSSEAGLALTRFRAYDPELGRWLSRDPLGKAELRQGPNLYAYVGNEPVDNIDPQGLAITTVDAWCENNPVACAQLTAALGASPVVAAGVAAALPEAESLGGEGAALCGEAFSALIEQVPSLGEVIPQAEPFAGYDIQGVIYQGAQLENWLVEEGEIGGEVAWGSVQSGFSGFGPNAMDLLGQSSYYEDLFMAANRYLPITERLAGAHRYAVQMMGFDVYDWL